MLNWVRIGGTRGADGVMVGGEVDQTRDAYELDITVEEARAAEIVMGNETYIGRRVIASNMDRELPAYIDYLTGRQRHIICRPKRGRQGAEAVTDIEQAFTDAFRAGDWLQTHIRVIQSSQLHGRGVFVVSHNTEAPTSSDVQYVPAEDFVFPLRCRELQSAPMVAVVYHLTSVKYMQWASAYKWREAAVHATMDPISEPDRMVRTFDVAKVLFKVLINGTYQIQACWFNLVNNMLLTGAEDFTSGFIDPGGNPLPATMYPIFPVNYKITENPLLIEQHGRGFLDMHDQEALTMIWTGAVNGIMRASEVYVALDEEDQTSNPEIAQTAFVVAPGRVVKKKVKFFSPPWPDPTLLQTASQLRTENAANAGQTDFAAINRKDARKTATELDMAQEQAAANKSMPLTVFAVGYRSMLQYVWDLLVNNVVAGINKTFLEDKPEVRAMLAEFPYLVFPAGDIDYLERQQQLQSYMQLYPQFANTPLGPYFLKKICELAFPNDYKEMLPLLQDNTKAIGAALFQALSNIPRSALEIATGGDPKALNDLQQLMQLASQTFNAPINAQADGAPAQPVA